MNMETVSRRRMLRRFKLKEAVIQLRRVDEDESLMQKYRRTEGVQQGEPSQEPVANSDLSGFPCKLCGRTFRGLPLLYLHSYRMHKDVRWVRDQIRTQRAKGEKSKIVPPSTINKMLCGVKLKQAVIRLQHVPEKCLQIESSRSTANHENSKAETVLGAQSSSLSLKEPRAPLRNLKTRIGKKGVQLEKRNRRKKLKNREQSNHRKQKLKNVNCVDLPSQNSKKSARVDKPTVCFFCGKQFKTHQSLEIHMAVHTKEKPFPCKICNESFVRRARLVLHTKSHTDKDVNCPNCELRFLNRKRMESHAEREHGILPQILPILHPCEDCASVFPTAELLLSHSKTHEKVSVLFNCKHCDGTFTKKASLNLHVRSQHKDRVFHCTQCFRYIEFTRIGPHMDSHKRKLAKGDQVFNCKLCGRQFDSARSLRIHTKREHAHYSVELVINSNKPSVEPEVHPPPSVPCRDSASQLQTSNKPQVPPKTHSPVVPQATKASKDCSDFSSQFLTADKLQVPPNTHSQAPQAAKGFQCSICNMTLTKYAMTRHKELHSLTRDKYKCTDCELSFLNLTQLMRHKAETHKELCSLKLKVGKHKCPDCELSFLYLRQLMRHQAETHKELHSLRMDKYKCPNCELSFLHLTQFMRHQAETHLSTVMPNVTSDSNRSDKVFRTTTEFLKHFDGQHLQPKPGQPTSHTNRQYQEQRLQKSTHIEVLNNGTSDIIHSATDTAVKRKRHTVIKKGKSDLVECHPTCKCLSKDGVSLQEYQAYNAVHSGLNGQGPSSTLHFNPPALNNARQGQPQLEIHKEQHQVREDQRNIPDRNWNRLLPGSNPVQVELQALPSTNKNNTDIPQPHLHGVDRSGMPPRVSPLQFQHQVQASTPHIRVDPYRNWNEGPGSANPEQIPQLPSQNNMPNPRLVAYRSAVLQNANHSTPPQLHVVPYRVESSRYPNPVQVEQQRQIIIHPHRVISNEVPQPQRVNPLQIEHRAQTSSSPQFNNPQTELGLYLRELLSRSANPVQNEHQTQNSTNPNKCNNLPQHSPHISQVIQSANQMQIEQPARICTRENSAGYSQVSPYRNAVLSVSIPSPIQIEQPTQNSTAPQYISPQPQHISYRNQVLQSANLLQIDQQAQISTHNSNASYSQVSPYRNEGLSIPNPVQIEHRAQTIRYYSTPQSHLSPHGNEVPQRTNPVLIQYQAPNSTGTTPQYYGTQLPQIVDPNRNAVVRTPNPVQIERGTPAQQISIHYYNTYDFHRHTYHNSVLGRANPVQLELQRTNPVQLQLPQANPVQLQLPQANPVQFQFLQANPVQFQLPQAQANPAQFQLPQANPDQFELQRANSLQLQPQRAHLVQLEFQRAHHAELERANPAQVEYQRASPAQVELQRTNPGQVEYQRARPAQVELQRTNPAQVEYQRASPAQVELQRANPAQVKYQRVNLAQVELQRANPAQVVFQRTNPAQVEHQSANPVQFEVQGANPGEFEQRTNLVQVEHQSANLVQVENKSTNLVQVEHQSANLVQVEDKSANLVQVEHQSANLVQAEHQSANPVQFELQGANPAQFEKRTSPVQPELQAANPAQFELHPANPEPVEHERAETVQLELEHTIANLAQLEHTSANLVQLELQRASTLQHELQKANSVQLELQRTNPVQLELQRAIIEQLEHHRANIAKLEHQIPSPVQSQHLAAHPVQPQHQTANPVQIQHQIANPVQIQHQIPNPVQIQHQITNTEQIQKQVLTEEHGPDHNTVHQGLKQSYQNEVEVLGRVDSVQIQHQTPQSAPVLNIKCVDCGMVFGNVSDLIRHRLIEKLKMFSGHN